MQDIQNTPLWTPSRSRVLASQITAFGEWLKQQKLIPSTDYQTLWQFSIDSPDVFWSKIWAFCKIIGQPIGPVLTHADQMLEARFFEQATLNYAQNLLERGDPEQIIIWFFSEGEEPESYTRQAIQDLVSRYQQALIAEGVTKGDVVAGFAPNHPSTLIAMLATTSLGAIWTSASPDFGINGAIDRFGQTEPKILFSTDSYWYNGKIIPVHDKVKEVVAQLPSVKKWIEIPYVKQFNVAGAETRYLSVDAWIRPFEPKPLSYVELPFNHPLFVLYSSGTTGQPKCIIHSHGGTLIQHLKEHQLHCDIQPLDTLFFYTTCGWMMWNWLVSALASQATIVLYDGSPFAQDGKLIWQAMQDLQVTHMGISAKYIDTLKKTDILPIKQYHLPHLRSLLSTGSPLAPENFDWIYQNIKNDLHLASISGGTDIISCFALGNPNLPVYRGELQCKGLGMAVEILDDKGKIIRGQKGELACAKPFPSQPVGFWNDPEQTKYKKAYFSRFEEIWCHGDFAEETPHGGLIIHGRSDAVLNPNGVRIGTAEIYRQVEQFPEVLEALAVGQQWNNDERVILFVRLKESVQLSDELIKAIKAKIRHGASPRHVPDKIIAVTDLPRTRSGKLAELAVKHAIHGEPVQNTSALANPESLGLFHALKDLES